MYDFVVTWYDPDSGVYISKTVRLDKEAIVEMAMDAMIDTPMWSILRPLTATVNN